MTQGYSILFHALRLTYSALWRIALPFVLVRLWWRGRKNPAYRRGWTQRLGFGPAPAGPSPIWVHAASVGEIAATAPLIRALINERTVVVLTTTTPTGADKAKQLFGSQVSPRYLPLDTPGAVRRFLATVQPQLGVIIETEIWPNLLYGAATHDVPIVFANARLSARTLAGHRRVRRLIVPVLDSARLIATQTEADAERFRSLGVTAEHVEYTGNLKYDATAPLSMQADADVLRQRLSAGPIILAASSHADDESAIIEAFEILRETTPTAQLLLAPRHPERFATVADDARQRGFDVAYASVDQSLTSDIVIGDQMGALTTYYATADIAVLGGTFAAIGGHNPIEAVLAGCPIIIGPHHERISDTVTTFGTAFTVVSNNAELAKALLSLSHDPAYRQHLGAAATRILTTQCGTANRLSGYIRTILKSAGQQHNV